MTDKKQTQEQQEPAKEPVKKREPLTADQKAIVSEILERVAALKKDNAAVNKSGVTVLRMLEKELVEMGPTT